VKARYRWALSGTPLENKLEDVTSIYGYLRPGLFRSDELLSPEMVKRRIKPYFLRRRTADVRKELPDKVVNEIWLELTEAQLQTYLCEEQNGKAKLSEPGATRVHVFALISRLKQICNIDPSTGESCKADFLVDQLDGIVESGQKALVFSHLPQVSLSQIEPRLRDFGTATFDGRLSDIRRDAIIQAFQNHDRPAVLLMSVQAGGTGLTLTAANHVFHFDHWWNPAVARQAEGRAHRIGQEHTVFVYDLYTESTIEQRIYNLLQEKQALFDAVIDDLSVDYVQGKITDNELFGLFGLKPPASEPVTTRAVQSKLQVATAGRSLTSQPNQKLDDLTPLEFEHFVANLYEKMGYRTELTSQSHDHGIDIIGRRQGPFGIEKIIVQCKHYPGGTVGEAVVRDLIGAWQNHRDAKTAILATSGRFSSGAVIMAQRHQVVLTDRTDLERLHKAYPAK
jgi:HJR/Mrr/RecB family endonuclease